MTEYVETRVPPGDTQIDVLEAIAQGQPWAFIVAGGEGDALDLLVQVGGGIKDATLLRTLLIRTLDALPGGASTERADRFDSHDR